MSIRDWWRRRMGSGTRKSASSRVPDETAIAARVDLVRLEAFAEAAYEAMRECRAENARSRYEEARAHFDRAIDAAHRANLNDEAARLARRRDQIGQVYQGQMRYLGNG
jgi:hypothetical protein